jgi:hypothetical protein
MFFNNNHTSGHEWTPEPGSNDLLLEKEDLGQERESALVRRIEELNVFDSERINLILVWKGVVPTANFIIAAQNPPLSAEEQDTLCQKVETLFTDLGLTYIIKADYRGHENGNRFYQVAKSGEILKEFIHIDFSDRTNYERIGLMYGFPQTAAHAYAQGPHFLIRDEDIPAKIKSQDYMAFSKFWFSKDHWQEELETVKKWAEQIRHTDPKLYERMIEYHKAMPFPLFKMGRITTEEVPHTRDVKYVM